jgi:hypothetical protein
MHLKLRQFQNGRFGNALGTPSTDDVQPVRCDGVGSHPKLIRQIAASGAIIAVAVGIRDTGHARTQHD